MSQERDSQDTVASFCGTVRCGAPPFRAGASFFTLSGFTGSGTASGAEPLTVTFAGCAPTGLPQTLESPRVEHLQGEAYLIREGAREWPLSARAVHRHRELPGFYSVIEPRVPPWRRRTLWRLLLGLAARPAGFALLRRLRGR